MVAVDNRLQRARTKVLRLSIFNPPWMTTITASAYEPLLYIPKAIHRTVSPLNSEEQLAI